MDAAAVEAKARADADAAVNRSILPEAPEEEDKEMAAFQSMLKEYLSRKSRHNIHFHIRWTAC